MPNNKLAAPAFSGGSQIFLTELSDFSYRKLGIFLPTHFYFEENQGFKC